ncbi:hypothetical protein [Plantactinospora veratri]
MHIDGESPVVCAELLAERGPDYRTDRLATPTFAVFTAVRPG